MNGPLAAVAHGQGGPFRVEQAVRAGYSRRDVGRLVEPGVWTRLRRGIYVESRLLDGERAYGVRAAAVVLALRPGTVCSHESAAVLHGLPLLDSPPHCRLWAEKLKQERLERDGFVVVRLNWQDVTEDAARSVARIRAAFQRSPRTPLRSAS